MRLADVVSRAVSDRAEPAAALAEVYAERIDESGHVGVALTNALAELRRAALLADESCTDGRADQSASKAYDKVAAALSAVTVAAELGPKLLAALDALLLTPKARAAAGEAVKGAAGAKPANPMDALRAREDEVARQRAKRTG